MLYILALLIGVVAGLRAMTAPAAVAWGSYLGWLPVTGTWASFMGHWIAVGIFTILAIVELITDQLPSTPSRKVPQQFGARIVTGAFSGAVIGATRCENVKALVYVAALAPDEGEKVADVFYRAEAHAKAPKLAPDDNGLIYLPGEAFAAAFAQNAPAEELAVLQAVQRPISPACITARMERPLWRDRPVWFLIAEEDRIIASETQHFMATRMQARTRSLPVDHTPMVTAPGVVVELILDAVRACEAGEA